MQTFTTTVQKKASRSVIVLPFDPQTVWGVKQRYHVRGAVNGVPIRGALELEGEQACLLLGPAWRRDAGIDAGATVQVALELEGPQQGNVAPDFAAALAQEPTAIAFFDALPTFYRNNYVRWIEGAKKAETRATRIAETVALLKAGKRERL